MPAGRPSEFSKELGDEILPSIYGLFDDEGNLRYIGKANDPLKRLSSHMRDSKYRQTPVYDWIRKHGKPEIRVLEANCKDWKEAERRLIADARARGCNLLNLAEGGDQPNCSIEVRRSNGANSKSWERHHQRMKDDVVYKFFQTRKLNYTRMVRMYDKLGDHQQAEDYRIQMRKMAIALPDVFGKWKTI